MKKIGLLFFLFMVFKFGLAQQSILRDNEFTLNPFVVSPSQAGANGSHEIFLNYANHFTGLRQSPNSAWVNYNGVVKKNFGLGSGLRFEQAGAFRRIRFDFAAAYHLKIGTNQKLSFGLGFNVTQLALDFSNSNSDPLNDLGLNSSNLRNGLALNATFGISYAWKNLLIAVSAPSIIPMKKQGSLFLVSENIHIRAFSSYNIIINRKWALKPQVIVDYIINAPINYCGVVGLKYNNIVWLNLGYGAQSILNAGLGTLIANRVTLQYTFKYGLSGIAQSNLGNHEICLGVVLGALKKDQFSNSIFNEKSKTPYHDWE